MARHLKEGRVHIYTGLGKGKTTAGLGLGLRAASSGLRVCIFQFLKGGGASGENRISLPGFRVVCFDEMHPMFEGPVAIGQGSGERLGGRILKDLKKVKSAMMSRRYDVIILDEIINCLSEKFINEKNILELIELKPRRVELVLTGRGASRKLIRSADYVTRLDKVKHPFDKGILARRGIEY